MRDYDRRSSDQKAADTEDSARAILRMLIEAGAVKFVPGDMVEMLEQAGVYYQRGEGAVTNFELRQMAEAEPKGMGESAEAVAVRHLAAELLRARRVVEAVIKERICSDAEPSIAVALASFLRGE